MAVVGLRLLDQSILAERDNRASKLNMQKSNHSPIPLTSTTAQHPADPPTRHVDAPPPTSALPRREELVAGLNQDLAREYQAIISYVIYSQVLRGAEFMNIAAELKKHAAEELQHALIVANQIDYLGGTPATEPQPVRTSTEARAMLEFDLENETETIRQYRARVLQCEALGEYATGEHIREILVQEQDHLIALATALGRPAPAIAQEPAPPAHRFPKPVAV